MRRYFTPRCIGMHVTLLVVLPAFAWLTWWQFDRATSGNTLSWAYTFEWPLFAGYAIYMWWQLIHDEPTVLARRLAAHTNDKGGAMDPHDQVGWALEEDKKKAGETDEQIEAELPDDSRLLIDDEEEDAELAEYNRYLAELNASDSPKTW